MDLLTKDTWQLCKLKVKTLQILDNSEISPFSLSRSHNWHQQYFINVVRLSCNKSTNGL